jgi:transcription termination/antitermination protein NusG
MNLSKLGPCWYALQTKVKHEHIAAAILKNKGYEEFLPLCHQSPSVRDREEQLRREELRPLYPGYIFCRFNPNAQGRIVTTPGVVRILGYGTSPAVVSEIEIENIRKILASNLTFNSCAYLNIGQRVRLVSGPLKGVEGILARFKGHFKVVVSVHVLQRSSEVEVKLDWIQPSPMPMVKVGAGLAA